MKTVIFTVCLFILIIAVVTVNSIYINKTSDLLCKTVQNLPEATNKNCADEVNELSKEWKNHRNIIELSIGLVRLEEIDNLISSLEVYSHSKCVTEFERTRAILLNALEEIREFERLNFFDIF